MRNSRICLIAVAMLLTFFSTPAPVGHAFINPPPDPVPGCDLTRCVYAISGSSNDAGPIWSNCAFGLSNPEIYLGKCDNGVDITSGFRFQTTPELSQGKLIKRAFLWFTADGPYTGTNKTKLFGEASANASVFSVASPPSSRPTLAPPVSWNITRDWTVYQKYSTVDIRACSETWLVCYTVCESPTDVIAMRRKPHAKT
jgi:hypothetical protein